MLWARLKAIIIETAVSTTQQTVSQKRKRRQKTNMILLKRERQIDIIYFETTISRMNAVIENQSRIRKATFAYFCNT